MKFFYALMVFFLSSYIFFWALVFVVPTPKIFELDSFVDSLSLSDKEKQEALPEILQSFESNKIGEKYYFEKEVDKKKGSAVFLSSIITFISIFLFVVLFNHKSHILFPLITALILALVVYSSLWLFNYTLGENIYLDLQNIRGLYSGIKSMQFLGSYLMVLLFIIFFGSWYRIE